MDEAQLEVPKKDVQFKTIKIPEGGTKEQKEKLKKQLTDIKKELEENNNQVWSEIGETNTHYYIAWSRAGDLIKKSVDLTTKHFKLNIPLAAEYMVGNNWKECH